MHITQVETLRSIFLSLSMNSLCFRSMILFWLRMTVRRLGMELRWLARWARDCSVRKFWERLSVATPPKALIILLTASSDSLLRMNFTVRTRLPRKNSQICRIIASPSSALVRSKVSRLSLYSN
jgi:hypothetical protein